MGGEISSSYAGFGSSLQTITLTGPVTGTGTGSFGTTITPMGFRAYGCSLSNLGLSSALMTMQWMSGAGATNGTDTHSGMSLVNGTYTVPAGGAGFWQFNAQLKVQGTLALNKQVDIQLQRNGSVTSRDLIYVQAGATFLDPIVADSLYVAVGDQLRIQISTDAAAPFIAGSTLENFFSGVRLSS